MRLSIVCLSGWLCVACGAPGEAPKTSAPQPVAVSTTQQQQQQPPPPAPLSAASATTFPLTIDGTSFVDAAGRPFTWRGITSFRLIEMVAHGRESDAAAYLDWAKSEQLTVVRVLLMAHYVTAEEGRRALPRLLDLAKSRGVAVEIVALADTKAQALDYDEHIREVGRIAAEKGNAFVELANEPGHPTQDPRLHEPSFLKRLGGLLPEPLVVALGSIEYGEGYAAGDYVTTHVPRGEKPWDHVFAVADLAPRVAAFTKPVVSDEPIGAGPVFEPGRRDIDPARFAAAAALTRLAGMSATFHYEDGLLSKIPKGVEAECFKAWKAGLALIDDSGAGGMSGAFLQGADVDRLARTTGAQRAYARASPDRAVILLLDPGKDASVSLAPEWREQRRQTLPGVMALFAERVVK